MNDDSKAGLRWSNLDPEPGVVSALDHAGNRPEDGNQDRKRRWSERFADGCAVAIADQFRQSALHYKKILPEDLSSGTEPLTPLGSGIKKRIDVTVTDPVLGLELGASLKGLNFRDRNSGNFDKNLTGRLYELGDEVRLVHDHLPRAFMTGVFFLPIDSTEDKARGNSSFANAVVKLRERTGRLDPTLMTQSSRCDLAFVGLYTTGYDANNYPKGIVRFFNVEDPPPRRGRPKVGDTLTLGQMVTEIVARATFQGEVEWGDPESDT